MKGIRVSSFRWATGALTALIGAMMLVVPHQFSSPVYAALQGALPLWGFGFLAIGLGLVSVEVLRPSPHIAVVVHILSGFGLLILAYGFVVAGAWTGATNWAVLGAASFLASVWYQRRIGGERLADLLPLALGIAAVLTGLTILALPGQFAGSIYDSYRSLLPWFGWAFLLAGAAISVTQLLPQLPSSARLSTYLLLATVFVAYFVEAALPLRAWTGIAYYGGMSLALLALTPFLEGIRDAIDPEAFSTRLALLLAAVVTLVMIVLAAAMSGEQEKLARADAEARMQMAAVFIGSDISHYMGTYRSGASALATYPGLLDLPVASQRDVLQRFARAYPEANVFSTYDVNGRGLARSDDTPPIADISQLEVFQRTRRTLSANVEVQISSTLHVPIFALGAPVLGADGRFVGQVGTSLRSDGVAELINRVNENRISQVPGRRVYLVDGAGRAIAHPDQALTTSFADLSSTPQVARLLGSTADQGIVSSTGPAGDLLAAYARVPDLGWAVVVQQPASDALASERAGRDAAFGLLLVAVFAAVVAGTLSARWLSGPLATLSRAAGLLAAGDSSAVLPRAGVSEIRRLVVAFREMREKLDERTAEREQLLETVQAQNEELQVQSEELQSQNEELLTQGKEMERLLAELGQSQEHLLEHAKLLDLAHVLIRDTSDRVTTWNSGAETLYGFKKEEAIGQVSHDLLQTVFPESMEATHEAIHREGHWQGELIHTGKDGHRIVVASHQVLYRDSNGNALAVLEVNNDITERKVVEAEREHLLQAEQQARATAEAAVKVRDEFISVAAHELKTPITSLQGFAQLITRQFERTGIVDPERLMKTLSQIRLQTGKLTRLSEQLLDLSRLETGKLVLTPKETDLSTLVRGAVDTVQYSHPERMVELLDGASLVASVDSLRIEQVITNLLDNAIKFSPAGSPVVVEIGSTVDGWAEIAVRDYGIGIPSEKVKHVFEAFYQAHPERHLGGMGIGLHIGKEMVEMHGGSIRVEQPAEGGSRFVVRLPLSKSEEEGRGDDSLG